MARGSRTIHTEGSPAHLILSSRSHMILVACFSSLGIRVTWAGQRSLESAEQNVVNWCRGLPFGDRPLPRLGSMRLTTESVIALQLRRSAGTPKSNDSGFVNFRNDHC